MSLTPTSERAEALFLAACDLPAAERAAFLARECGGDPALRREVEALLADLDRAATAGFLEPGPWPDEPPRLPARTRLGEYEVVRLLGTGGSGRVYEARHTRLGRRVAVKVLSDAARRDPDALARFRREVTAVGAVSHPNVVAASDARQFGAHLFLVTEFLEGVTVRELLRAHGPLPVADAAEVARQLAAGVQCLADHGVTHRDLSPSNVMVTTAGRVAILDLGLAALAAGGTTPRLTGTGLFVGTVGYVAPEQAEDARSADSRSDQYSVGCLLHALLVGHPPFRDDPDAPVRVWLNRLAAEPPPDVRRARPEVPAPVADVCARLLATRPADRFDAPGAAAELLAPFAAGNTLAATARAVLAESPDGTAVGLSDPPRAASARRSRRRALAGVSAVALLVAAALVLAQALRPRDGAPRRDPPPAEVVNSVGMRLRLIPAGAFVMGSPPGEWARMDLGGVEAQRRVVVPRAAYAGAFEVTQGEYRAVTGANPSHFAPAGPGAAQVAHLPWDRLPVDTVSWLDATGFCRRLTARPEERAAGRVYRLPSEEEWEYACRAGTTTPFHAGESLSSLQANIQPDPVYPGVQQVGPYRGHPVPVGSFPANAFGLHDMHGNVMEWTGTAVPGQPGRRVTRGGHWFLAARDARSAARGYDLGGGVVGMGAEVGAAGPQYGFRVWCDVPAGP